MSKNGHLLVAVIVGWFASQTANARPFVMDEVHAEFDQVTALIESTKKAYEDWYLFVARVTNVKVAPRDGAEEGDLVDLAPQGATIEILIPVSSCKDSVTAAFVAGAPVRLILSNIRKTLFVATPDSPLHEYFLKVEPIDDGESFRPGCILVKG